MFKKISILLISFAFVLPVALSTTASAQESVFPQSEISISQRRLTDAEKAEWIAEYEAMGGYFTFELEVIRLINNERRQRGLSELQLDLPLMLAARFYAQNMSVFGFGHNVGPYQIPGASHGASMNVAAAFCGDLGVWNGGNSAAGQWTPEDLVRTWMNSPGHIDFILYEPHRYIGMGSHIGGQFGVSHYMFLSNTASADAITCPTSFDINIGDVYIGGENVIGDQNVVGDNNVVGDDNVIISGDDNVAISGDENVVAFTDQDVTVDEEPTTDASNNTNNANQTEATTNSNTNTSTNTSTNRSSNTSSNTSTNRSSNTSSNTSSNRNSSTTTSSNTSSNRNSSTTTNNNTNTSSNRNSSTTTNNNTNTSSNTSSSTTVSRDSNVIINSNGNVTVNRGQNTNVISSDNNVIISSDEDVRVNGTGNVVIRTR